MSEPEPLLPVTLLTGFLGAGKTTLANRILSERHGEPIAVIVNEFGELGIDGRLVVGASEEVVELANGCLCCTLRGDLSRALGGLLKARRRRFGRRPFERVLIESSGLASPGPIAQTLAVDGALAEAFELDGVLALAHAGRISAQLEEHPEASEQLAYADRVLLNHVDQADEAELERAERAVSAVNPTAERLRSVRAEVPIGPLLTIGSGAPERWRLEGLSTAHGAAGVDAHEPGQAADKVGAVALESERPLDLHRLKMWLRFLATRRGQEVFRMKGVLRCVDHDGPVIVQAVYEWLELGPGEGSTPERSSLVLLGRGLDREELLRGWETCLVQPG